LLSSARNTTSGSTKALARPDGFLYPEGWPPMRKLKMLKSVKAERDLTDKIRWLPHYDQLAFFIVIAIAGMWLHSQNVQNKGYSFMKLLTLT
jgi:hypothetical protein